MLTSGARPSTDERNTRNPVKGSRAERSPARNADGIFNAAFELVATPALFAFLGYLLDGRLNTGRLFTFLFAGVVAVYEVWKLWYGYNSRIDELHAEMFRPKTKPAAVGDES
ncbi:MAG: AtpZ/AtpI family protein [Acidimicrobiia bacterium]|nr:AtpZ/AtpI family protein [Acidimicrobiia bacterium]MDH5289624.1 AtpZ/AtpI family protein [Acidimicrobiia bacterium]